MTGEQVRKLLRVRPFRAFGLRLADGEVVRVTHPDFALLSPTGRTLHVFEDTTDESYQIVDVFLVTAIETLGRRNGSGRARRR